MEDNVKLSIELFSLTKLYIAKENLDQSYNNLNDWLNQTRKRLSTPPALDLAADAINKGLAAECKRYTDAFYRIVLSPLMSGKESVKFGAFAKMFNFDYKKFVCEYLEANRARIVSEFYTFAEGGSIKLNRADVVTAVNNFIDVTTWLITDSLKCQPYQFASHVDNKDDKIDVLTKVFNNSVHPYYKELVAELAEYKIPMMRVSHAGESYDAVAAKGNVFFPKIRQGSSKPILYPSFFLYFIKPQKTFKTNAWVKKPKVDKFVIQHPTTGCFELQSKLAAEVESHARKLARDKNALTELATQQRAAELELEGLLNRRREVTSLINNVIASLDVIPPYYAQNSDAIKKMCFLFINKRASNVQDLINLYETEQWRSRLIQSVEGFKNVIATSQRALQSQLSTLNAQTALTNKGLAILVDKVNNLKIDVDVKTTVYLENQPN